MFIERIQTIQEELVMLCEIRGELDVLTNEKTEKAIARLTKELKFLEGLQTELVVL